ncbi:MAG: elongation factor Ts [Proteobacteria bacterium]|nr:elongation factor Ts [Pseudomonadota bacterium]
MTVTAQLVKELREITGVGMMDCKKALSETDGDLEKAVEYLRKAGQAKADKKASRVAAEGKILISADTEKNQHTILEINCETDFVAKDEKFNKFSESVLRALTRNSVSTVEELSGIEENGSTIDDERKKLIAEIGENISIRRFSFLNSDNTVGSYIHMGRIGVMVEVEGSQDEDLAKDLAMHIAANNPLYKDENDVPAEELEKEKEILKAQALAEGKPEDIIEKMIQGRLNKYLEQITLYGQPFVKDPDIKVSKLLENAGASIKGFIRYELGEGIEKKKDDFVEEVKKQAGLS